MYRISWVELGEKKTLTTFSKYLAEQRYRALEIAQKYDKGITELKFDDATNINNIINNILIAVLNNK